MAAGQTGGCQAWGFKPLVAVKKKQRKKMKKKKREKKREKEKQAYQMLIDRHLITYRQGWDQARALVLLLGIARG